MRRLFLILFLVAISSAARADQVTMELTGVGSPGPSGSTPPGQNVWDGVYTFPYFFSVGPNSSPYANPNTALICDDYTDDIYFGESWNANVYTLSQAISLGQMTPNASLQSETSAYDPSNYVPANPTKAQAYDAAAWLDAQLLNYGMSTSFPTPAESEGFNIAIWAVFSNSVDPNALTTPYNLGILGANATPGDLIVDAFQNTTNGYSNPDQILFYTPILGSQSTGGRPQEFMGDAPAPPVPEPASLLLLGTGLLGLAQIMRKKLRA